MIIGWGIAGLLFLVLLECRTRMRELEPRAPSAIVIEPEDDE